MVIPRTGHAEPNASARADVVAAADLAAGAAAGRAGVVVRTVDEMDDLLAVSKLLESVWGRNAEGVPINSELMRSLTHVGGCTTAAFDESGVLVGAAVLCPTADPVATYSLIAAAAPGRGDGGIGQALKLGQRAWALARGHTIMRWTFDPLVGRNARFNLAKLGADAREYEVNFYGRMSDELNRDDEADRLVATWVLDSDRAVRAAEGTADEPAGPAEDAEVLSTGPDRMPMVLRDQVGVWIRVPRDIVAIRRDDLDAARLWRFAARDAFLSVFADGLAATHVTRQSYYLLTARGDQ